MSTEADSAGPSKRRRLNVHSDAARARVESVLREQLDLELYLKQKEINAISTRLRHGEALLEVLETAIRAQPHEEATASDIADGFLNYFHELGEAGLESEEDAEGFQSAALADSAYLRDRPRRAAAVAARYTTGYYDTVLADSTDEEAGEDSPADTSGSRDSTNSSGGGGTRQLSRTAPHLGSLANKLDAEQLSSVADALEFIGSRGRQRAEASSTDGSDSDDGPRAAFPHSKHGGQDAQATASTSVLVQPARESRFHIIRRAMLGNTSQYVDLQSRPPGKEKCTHRWTVYVRSPSAGSHPGEYIRKVRVFLHPSYRPDDIVDLTPPVLELTRWGWGEFPVRLQVFFHDRRNRPMDLIHVLRLDDLCSGNEVLGSEMPIDFELDRRGFTGEETLAAYDALQFVPAQIPPPPTNAVLRQLMKVLCSLYPLTLNDAVAATSTLSKDTEGMFAQIPPAIAGRWTWGIAVSTDSWRSEWPLGKRLSAEHSRNRVLLKLISAAIGGPGASAEGSELASDHASTREYALRVIGGVLDDAGADSLAVSVTTTVVDSADASVCRETIDMLRLWANEFNSSRPFHPDRDRGPDQRQYTWSLKRWLRANKFVPLPVLSPAERASYLPEQTTRSDATDATSTFGAATRPRDISGLFCNACGLLVHQFSSGADDRPGTNSRVPLRSSYYCCDACKSAGSAAHATTTSVGDVLSALPEGWDKSEDECGSDVELVVDSLTRPCATTPDTASGDTSTNGCARFTGIAASMRSYHQEQQQARDLGPGDLDPASVSDAKPGDLAEEDGDDQEIDWVWSVVRPLELNCATASRLSIAGAGTKGSGHNEDGDNTAVALVRLPNGTDEALEEALNQRLVVGRLLLDATKLFLRDLVTASDSAMRRNRIACDSGTALAPADAERLLMLTPLHVLAATKQDPQSFDICTNAHMASGS
ncbi:hypothetical protein GGF46_002350 [Coemansia sp. RSA 552]|nr:hypothetical protein GGF46_002350 [Coemansia sp. RSA 552]